MHIRKPIQPANAAIPTKQPQRRRDYWVESSTLILANFLGVREETGSMK